MRILFLLVALFYCRAEAYGFDLIANAVGERITSRLAVSKTSKARFAGYGVGGALVAYAKHASFDPGDPFQGYGFALSIGYFTRNLDNTANTSTSFETLIGSEASIGARIYGLGLFVGGAVKRITFELSNTSNGSVTVTNYKGLGARFEAGMQLPLASYLILTPIVHYDITDVNSTEAYNPSKRLNDFGVGFNLGLRF